MSYRVTTGRLAEEDLFETAAFLSDRTIDGAIAWIDAFEAAKAALAEFAAGCPLAPEDERARMAVRERYFSTRRGRRYRILFTIVGDEVRILRVRGPGQDLVPPDGLEPE